MTKTQFFNKDTNLSVSTGMQMKECRNYWIKFNFRVRYNINKKDFLKNTSYQLKYIKCTKK